MDKLERLIKDIQDPNSQYNRRKRFEQNVKRNQKAFDRYKSEQQSKKDDEEEELPVEILKPSEKIILRKKKELGGKFASTEWYRNAMTSELKEVQEDYDFSHLDDTFGFDEGHFYFLLHLTADRILSLVALPVVKLNYKPKTTTILLWLWAQLIVVQFFSSKFPLGPPNGAMLMA